MSELQLLPEFMSNYLVYFLLQNGLDVNCSVYSLTLGTIASQDYYTGAWSSNILDFLPAYYVTNCLIDNLVAQIQAQNIDADDVLQWLSEFRENPYNDADNGDLFVALLYTILGLCVSCWMLILMFVLLPKYKRKPLLTHLAMLFYLVVLTVILAQITLVAADEYYADSLNMISILSIVHDKGFPSALMVLQCVTNLAFVQLVWRMTKLRWKRPNAAFGAVLVAVYLVLAAVDESLAGDSAHYVTSSLGVLSRAVIVVEVFFMGWFAVCLGYYTLKGTALSPRKVLYSRKLLPLATLTWAMILLHVVISLLIVSLWRGEWLVTLWISFIPLLLDMYILTTGWEWFYSIRDLELKAELVGMLGRKISLDDVMSFSNDRNVRRATLRGKFASFFEVVLGRHKDTSESITGDNGSGESDPTDSNTTKDDFNSGSTNQGIDTTNANNTNAGLSDPAGPAHDIGTVTGAHDNYTHDFTTRATAFTSGDLGTSRSYHFDDDEAEYEVHFADSDMWDEPEVGTSHAGHADELPQFQPHPGYSRDDYWDEK